MTSSITLDPYVLDTLMRDLVGHDRRSGAYLVYLAIVAAQAGGRVVLSHQQLAARTGLAKRTVQDAVVHLERRGLLAVERRSATEAALLTPLTPWRR